MKRLVVPALLLLTACGDLADVCPGRPPEITGGVYGCLSHDSDTSTAGRQPYQFYDASLRTTDGSTRIEATTEWTGFFEISAGPGSYRLCPEQVSPVCTDADCVMCADVTLTSEAPIVAWDYDFGGRYWTQRAALE